jgi:hypothetical protein
MKKEFALDPKHWEAFLRRISHHPSLFLSF